MLEKLLGFLLGGGGALGAVAGVAKSAGLLALAPLAWHWFQGHGQDIVVTFTVAQAVFVVGIVVALVQVAHSARSSS